MEVYGILIGGARQVCKLHKEFQPQRERERESTSCDVNISAVFLGVTGCQNIGHCRGHRGPISATCSSLTEVNYTIFPSILNRRFVAAPLPPP